jgi:cardiolipin synthase
VKERIQKIKKRRIVAVATVLFHVFGFGLSIHSVMSTRTSQGAIAWAVSLNTFPYIAVPLYLVFGRNKFRGYVTARQEGDQEIQYVAEQAYALESTYRARSEGALGAAGAGERMAKIPIVTSNDVELLINGEATFASILEGIDAARDYILVQFYIVKDDGLGRDLQSRLIAKAEQGVRVYFLFDEVGSYKLPDRYVEQLRAAGARAHNFHTRRGPTNRFQINFRNHRKIVVVDGRTAWVGGHNVGDEYLGKGPLGAWRDTHVKIEGPAVQALQLAFLEDWHWATREVPDVEWTPEPAEGDDVEVLIVPTGPADALETAGLMFIHAINSAERRIWIASPYFVPDEAVVAALQLAGLRGVDVRILIPDNPDHMLVYLSAFSYFKEAGHTGVKFFRYEDGFMHGKAMLIDDHVSAVGTANMDNRSFRLNFEVTAFVGDTTFASEVERMFLDDFANSRQMEPADYEDRSFWFKLAVQLARLTAPVQ